MLTGSDRVCPICEENYRAFTEQGDAYGWFCWECRKLKGATNSKQCEELYAAWRELSQSDKDKWREEALSKRNRGGRVIPAAPPVDKEKVAAAVRTMIAYGRLVHEPVSNAMPTEYVIAQNGLFEVRHSDIADIVLQPKEVMGVTQALKPGVHLNIPKVPYSMLAQTVAFFRGTCKQQKGSSEALVQIWWNTQDKRYEMHVPDQRVSGGGVNHSSTFDQEQARTASGEAIWLHVLDIHSHGSSMGGFWSTTDDNDERKAPEGRMFGVIGKVLQPLPDWRWRLRTREGFIDLTVVDIFDFSREEAVPFHVGWDVILSVASQKDGVDDRGGVLLRCPVDPFKDATCPEEWHAKVTSSYRGGHHFGACHGREVQHGKAGSGWMGSPSSTVVPSYIYIRSASGETLDEYEIDGHGAPKATGHQIVLPRSLHGERS